MKEVMKIKDNKTWIIILLGILFLYNGIQFLKEDGCRNTLLSLLFNMIIILFVIILMIHKNEIKYDLIKQTILDDYFTIK